MALGPQPQRELTPMLALGIVWPRSRMAAGAPPKGMIRSERMLGRRDFLRSAARTALLGAAGSNLAFPSALTSPAHPVPSTLPDHAALQASPSSPVFEEVPASTSGISWIHENARSPQRFLPESLGPGCAFLDYDNDGWMDIYLVNSGPCDFYQPAKPLKNALYRNNRDGTFTDVTDKAGVAGGTFGMGIAVGDYDNDGFPDIFVTAYGRCLLYHNNGDGTFTDVTSKAGVATPGWTTSAVWFDYDNDGLLDLFVCSYVRYDLSQGLLCADKDKDGRLYYHYCIPHLFKPTPSVLWHNNGNGTFTQAGHGTEIERSLGKALGVVATDVNDDGLMDLFVANDTAQNFLFVNRGKGRWRDRALAGGVAYGSSGRPRSGMGVDAADVDGDGRQDLFVANIDHEMFALYRNDGGELFTDVSRDHGVGDATLLLSGWGLKFLDVDNDGRVDLLLANGHPDDMIARRASEVEYREPLLLFRHDGRRLRNISAQAGPVFAKSFPARGLAAGDFNNDGRVDALVGCNGESPLLLRNTTSATNHWIGVKLQGVTCNRDAVGTRLTWSADGVKRSRLKAGGGSYLSSHDPREVLGLGGSTKLDWLEIKWPPPSGKIERFTSVPIDRYVTITEGKGIQT
jgi:enediyne biosynthesis protein E4